MNKFLELCFKVSKWVLSLVLVLILLTGGFFTYKAISTTLQIEKVKNLKIVYTFPDTMISENKTANNIEEVGASYEKYEESVTEATQKANIYNSEIWGEIMTNLSKIKPEDREDFINNLPTYFEKRKPVLVNEFVADVMQEYPYYNESTVRHNVKTSESMQQHLNKKVLELYFSRYSEQANFKENAVSQLVTVRQIQLYSILACLYLFITCLIIPILLKIEENTRK